MLIRPAEKADVPTLTAILRRSWLTTWAPELPFAAVQVFAAEDPARIYAESMWNAFMAADVAGTVVGMCHVVDDCVAAIHVDPAHKGRGAGTLLLDAAERRIGDAHDHARLEVLAFNVAARTFYARRGWVERRRYPGTECGAPVETIEMAKVLRRPAG